MTYKENPELEDDMVEAMFRRWRRGKFLLVHSQRRIYENIAAQVTDAVVCDVGFGAGLGMAILAQKARSVVGIEKVAGSVAFARKCFPLKNVRFLSGDVVECSFPNESFDAVVAIEVIEHIMHYRGALSQMARILKGSGTLYISSPNRNHRARGGPSHEGPPRLKHHVREWTAGEFRDALLSHFDSVALHDYTLVRSLAVETPVSPVVAICRDPRQVGS